jgi:hypothetical protein
MNPEIFEINKVKSDEIELSFNTPNPSSWPMIQSCYCL